MEIVPFHSDYASDIAHLHVRGIPTGFISSLDLDFVTALYHALTQSKHAFGFVVREKNRTLGFIAFADNLTFLYLAVLKNNFYRFSRILFRRIFSWTHIKKASETLLYAVKTQNKNLPAAELLAIVIDDQVHGRGLASKLLQRGLAECQNRGIHKVKVLVAADNQPANQLYHKFGFQLIDCIQSHNIPSNIYVKILP
jgi:ribosomal protein S18 acetylase RimI-like enzyme